MHKGDSVAVKRLRKDPLFVATDCAAVLSGAGGREADGYGFLTKRGPIVIADATNTSRTSEKAKRIYVRSVPSPTPVNPDPEQKPRETVRTTTESIQSRTHESEPEQSASQFPARNGRSSIPVPKCPSRVTGPET